jgi:hypothetical protein
MKAAFWSAVARFLARPAIVEWLIRRAQRTPYTHITGPDGTMYMERYWLFNPYPANSSGNRPWWQFPISIRLHRIMREDDDRHLHDHPWNARTFILRGYYHEIRPYAGPLPMPGLPAPTFDFHARSAGETMQLRYGEYHRIVTVSRDGVWTLFVTGRYQGTWGFLVDGVKVQWRRYLGLEDAA